MKFSELIHGHYFYNICKIAHPAGNGHWWRILSGFLLGYQKCVFCKTYCNRSEYPESKDSYRWWSCHRCGVCYSYHDVTGKLENCRYVRTIKDKEFMLYLDDHGTRLYVENPDDSWSSSPHSILQLDYKLRDVTPNNVQDKIRTLLTFS